MLRELEKRLLKVVRVAVPGMETGPTSGPAASDEELVAMTALALLIGLPDNAAEAATRRDKSYLSRRVEWDADGSVKDFPLPDDTEGEPAVVEAPPGHERRRGDDYFVEGQAICFYRAPHEGKVVARLRGVEAKGYKALRSCRIELLLSAWATALERADELCMRSVQAVLEAEPDLGSIERETQDTDVRMRLLKPLIEVASIRRSRSRVGETDYYHVAATLQVLGTLEITVIAGEMPPEGVIERIEYDVEGYARAGSIIPAGTEDR